MRELTALLAYALIGTIACVAYVAYGAPNLTKPVQNDRLLNSHSPVTRPSKVDAPPKQTCRFITCPVSAQRLTDCKESRSETPRDAATLFGATVGRLGFYSCGSTDIEFEIEKADFERRVFGGGK